MWLQNLFNPISEWMVRTFGYTTTIHFKDIMSSLMTFILGMLLMAFISSFFILRLHSVEDFGKSQLKYIRYDKKKNKSRITLSIPNIWVAYEAILFLSFSPFCTIKRFTSRDAKRTKRFIIWLQVIVAIIILFTIFINSVIINPLPQ